MPPTGVLYSRIGAGLALLTVIDISLLICAYVQATVDDSSVAIGDALGCPATLF